MKTKAAKFSDLLGLVLVSVEIIKDIKSDCNSEILFKTKDRVFRWFGSGECCAFAIIEEIHGDIQGLVGSPILLAEEVINDGEGNKFWCFYKLSTIKESVTIRSGYYDWFGWGGYSINVNFEEIFPDENIE